MNADEDYGELFLNFAAVPAFWVEIAQSLRLAACPVFVRFREITHSSMPGGQVRVELLGCVRAWMLLQATAFENLLKAIAANRGLITNDQNALRFDKSLRNRGGHGLLGIAEKLDLTLTSDESSLLRRLEEYLVWAGRYPAPLKSKAYIHARSNQLLQLSEHDPKVADALSDRLISFAKPQPEDCGTS